MRDARIDPDVVVLLDACASSGTARSGIDFGVDRDRLGERAQSRHGPTVQRVLDASVHRRHFGGDVRVLLGGAARASSVTRPGYRIARSEIGVRSVYR